MNYIVLDLEWNQNPFTREKEVKGFPFEIIEIGAVKLDDNKKIKEHFDILIKPIVYKQLHFKTKEIIDIKMEELQKGVSFKEAAERFFKWCGQDYILCTWGDMDLTELQRNLDYYNIKGHMDKYIKYYDVQKLFAINYEGKKNPKSLEYAVDYLEIEKKDEFHRASFDAEYTALIFQKLNESIVKEYYSVNYYHNPKSKEEEIHLTYDTYSKYVSMEYKTKEDAMSDKEVRSSVCYLCGKKAAKKIRWFSVNQKQYYCLAFCKEHGFIRGKVRVKRATSGNVFIVKTLKLVNEESAKAVKLRQEEVIKKRNKIKELKNK